MGSFYIAAAAFICLLAPVAALDSTRILLNQVGYEPGMPKIAVVRNADGVPFTILHSEPPDTVFRGACSRSKYWPYSEESVSRADFSTLRTAGSYVLAVKGAGISKPFTIAPHAFGALAAAAMKTYYYQRASITLEPKYAGRWARPEGHPDTAVLIHASAAGPVRKSGDTISAPGGWYDAGDYNKYIVNSGITTYTILSTYEDFPDYCRTMELNIPESGNGIPDIIDEALWNIRWMLKMQDPADGGVYAKLTNANFEGFIMPSESLAPRYVVLKTTGSALDFAAVMAQAARITKQFKIELPGFSDSCLNAALSAWRWARVNPGVLYDRKKMNASGQPEIHTGDYNDHDLSDEFAWAAAELTATTKQDSFLAVANPLSLSAPSVPGWPDVGTLGLYTFARFRTSLAGLIDTNEVSTRLLHLADTLRTSADTSAYGIVMGENPNNFGWGSNAIAANQAMELVEAFLISGDRPYLNAALANIDYLLGRNPTTYCYVTGFGWHSPMNIHHRISGADNIPEPVPGFLVGGPNPNKQDHAKTYTSFLPALGYTDDAAAYASNEICINWNAPLVYILVALEALQ